MAAGEARVRAWWGKTTLTRFRAQPEAGALMAAIGPELLALIDQSPRLGWVPMVKHAAMCDRVIAKVGSRRFLHILSTEEPDPVVAANMHARLDAIGDDPLVLLRHTATTWGDISADAGTVQVTSESPRCAVLSLENLPPVAMTGWLKLSFEALIQRALHATGNRGKIEASSSAASRTLVLRVSW